MTLTFGGMICKTLKPCVFQSRGKGSLKGSARFAGRPGAAVSCAVRSVVTPRMWCYVEPKL